MKISLFILALFFAINANSQTITTFAGGIGDDSSAAVYGRLITPTAITIDGAGNLYVADYDMNRIRKITPAGSITTYAGNGNNNNTYNGDGTLAKLAQVKRPMGVAIDGRGNLYISQFQTIRKVNPSGIISTYAGNDSVTSGFSGDGSLATYATFFDIRGLAVDGVGNLYIADFNNNRIRKIDTFGIITTIAGNGGSSSSGDGTPAIDASLNEPTGVAVDTSGNIFIAEHDGARIRKVNTSGIISTFAGNGGYFPSGFGGSATAASIDKINDVNVDAIGNVYFSSESEYIGKVNTSGILMNIAGIGSSGSSGFSGDGGSATAAFLNHPEGIAIDATGNVHIADRDNSRIRKVNILGVINTIVGNGINVDNYYNGDSINAKLSKFKPSGITLNLGGNIVFADQPNQRIRKINSSGIISTIAGNGITGYSGDGGPATAAELDMPTSVAYDRLGNLYIADYGTQHIRKVNTSGIISTVAGGGSGGLGDGGPATNAVISAYGLALDTMGNIYIADGTNNRIRKVNTSTGIITTIAGNGTAGYSGDGGAATAASLNSPNSVAIDKKGNLFIADISDGYLRKIDTNGIITTIPGVYCTNVKADSFGNIYTLNNQYYIYASNPYVIGRVDIYGYYSIVVGNGIQGYAGDDGSATAAELYSPTDVVFDNNGHLYIADITDYNGCIIRKVCCISNIIDHPPVFIHGNSQTMNVCISSGASNLDTLLSISDLDTGSTETWTITTPPIHGTLAGFPYSATSTGGIIMPTGISYTPTSGYSGTDQFQIRISDGTDTILATIMVHVYPLPDTGTISGAVSLCVGATTTLYETVTGGVWSSIHTGRATVGSTGIVTGVSAGIDTIRYTNINSCGTAIATHIITINPLPVAGTITGPTHVCESSTITLTNASTGGVWTSTDPYIAVGSSSGVIAGIAAGTAIVTYTVSNMCGTASTTTSITVNPIPYAGTITGSTTICVGNTTTLSDAIGGGTWSSGATGVATIGSTTGFVTGVAAGSVVISYSVPGSGCASAVAITIVNVLSASPILPITGSSSVCTGSTITLSDASSGGTWTSSNPLIATIGSTSGVVTGVSGGIVTISYTASLGCGVSIASTTVTVSSTASAGTLTGSSSVCTSGSGSIASSVSGGIWTASNSHATVSTGGIITGVSAGVDTLTYTVSTSCGSATATSILHIDVAPVAGSISGSTSLCQGTNTTLSESVTGGTWSSSNVTLATVNTSGMLTGIDTGIVIISYSVTNGCGTAIATHIDTILAEPYSGIITGITNICQGATTLLSDAASGGTWSSSNPSIATVGSTGLVTGIAAGTVIISYTKTNSCGTVSSLTSMTIDSRPFINAITGGSLVSVGGSNPLHDAVSGGTWSSSDTTKATIDASGVVRGIDTGSVTITYTMINSYGCTSDTTFHLNVILTTDIKEIGGASAIRLYPNPTKEEITINWQNEPIGIANIALTDIIGRQILSKQINITTNNGSSVLQLSGIKEGIYLFTLKTESENYTTKVIIMN